MLGPVADNDQFCAASVNSVDLAAQLRHLLAAEESGEVPDECNDGGLSRPRVAKLVLLAVQVCNPRTRGFIRYLVHILAPHTGP
jgi:hypothetical protein